MARTLSLKAVAAAVLCLLALMLAVPLRAQTITNTATANWTLADRSYSTASNTVGFSVASTNQSLETFTTSLVPSSSLAFTPSQCGGAVLPSAAGLGGATNIASVAQANAIHIGDVLFFRLVSAVANLDPTKIDVITAKITTTGGDAETIQIYETAPNSGIFIGAVPTVAIPPKPQPGDCRLSVAAGDTIAIAAMIASPATQIANAFVEVLADPFGLVFDSEDGAPVDGAKVTLVDAASGAPAQVFAPDGVTTWPSSVISGQTIVDGSGNANPMLHGEYRFPLVRLGQYRLLIEPPPPYAAPSTASAAQLSGILRPDGAPVIINAASYGGTLTLATTDAIRVDIPVDSPSVAVSVTKTASRATAQPGDVVFYTVVATNVDRHHTKRNVTLLDTPARQLRLRTSSVHIDGAANPLAVQPAPDGSSLTVHLGDIPAGGSRTVTYAMSVRPGALAGQALNKAVVTDSRGLSGFASTVVRIEEDNLATRMTLIGRIAGGGCTAKAPHPGIPGVRVMLEDGSFAVTDRDGRYHFDGLLPGTHVVQVMEATLPEGGHFRNCGRSTRQAGSAISRFVTGQGGSLAVADFHADVPEKQAVSLAADASGKDQPTGASEAAVASDRKAAGGDTDWLTLGDGPNDFLFPATDYNPRAPAVRVVIRHRPSQKVELSANGARVDALAYDGARTSADGAFAVSIWRGLPIEGTAIHLVAVVRNADGSIANTLTRDVHFNHVPVSVQVVPQLSHLVADGRTRPVLALRVLDRSGRPVHAGLSGDFALSAPYESAEAIDAMQSRALSGLGRSAPHWTVKGDDGIAMVELAPTMVSGALSLDFQFDDGQQKRKQTIESWVVPGDLKWTLVGLVEGAVGAQTIADAMERSGQFDSDLGTHARTAFYAKGRVLGRFLITAAYDSAKQRATQQLLGAIDPKAYYTVFADGSTRRFDAASRDKLYIRIESRAFTAVFGDFQTGFGQTQLARYQRTLTGIKAEAAFGGVRLQGFGARVSSTHRRDEFQGGGISGPYRLSSSAIVANSETVTIEVRDRFRSELVIDTRTLARFVDYDIDLLSGTISFKAPVLSRDASLNPQFIIINYDVDPLVANGGAVTAGLRGSYTTANGKLRVGATGITEKGDAARGSLVAIDLRARPTANTEIRAEAAVSRTLGANAEAWSVEAEHHDRQLDMLAYAHSADQAYGLAQSSGSELGRRKLGVDTRYKFSQSASIIASAWRDDSLVDTSHREALQVKGEYRTKQTSLRLGLTSLYDTLASGAADHSNLVEAGITRKLLGNRLEVEAATSFAIDHSDSIDLPTRDTLALRYALTSKVKLTASYEIASGAALHARTARAGFEMQPWKGARAIAGLGEQQVAEYGARSFAAFGLTQSLDVSRHLLVDATLDANKVLGGFDASKILNALQPVASGGQLSTSGTLAEAFTALTLGATWRQKLWTVTLRGEMRDGDLANRRGVTFGAIRQLGEGKVVGAGFHWTHAASSDGSLSSVLDSSLAWANRPANSPFALLTKLEFRADATNAATSASLPGAGLAGLGNAASSGALVTNGMARSRRLIGSFSANYSPQGRHDDEFVQRSEVSLFAAVRHNFDLYDGYDLAGTTLMAGLDAHIGLGERLEVGGGATIRANMADHTTSFSVGPRLGFVPVTNVLVTIGYNITGYRDRDFGQANATTKGIFASMRMKLDSGSFDFLGLGNRPASR